ncbi:PEP-CTERM sorting domain-containing protein [Roseateles sp. LYH14W]|uniref:PEP-CTERM sorting domain-containing protein n=1 Tax=Pelomonas parva TaxID=3299032 RepID=A0ABW7EZ94_9BURK
MHTTTSTPARSKQAGVALAVGLALMQGAAQATPVEFSFAASLNSPMVIGLAYDDLQSGWSSSMVGALPTVELAALRATNAVLRGSFGWDTAATGQHAPWASSYTGHLSLGLQQGGQPLTVANPAAGVSVVNDGSYGDILAVTWNTWPNSFDSGLLDIAGAQPQTTRLELNHRFTTGLSSLPVHVSYSDLHLTQLQVRLDDSSGQALSSRDLPGSLSLASFNYSAVDLSFLGLVTTEVRAQDFTTAEDFAAAQAWVDANVRFTYVQVSFTGLPYAPLTELTVSSVPEPDTWALAALGGLTVLGAARRRRQPA